MNRPQTPPGWVSFTSVGWVSFQPVLTIFFVDPDADDETLLANTCESLASASVMLSNVAGLLEGTHRNTILGIQQVVMLGELAVNRMLDRPNPQS
ncbi:DUF6124 family protein [Pseudomonas sp. BGI-2]|uniref:DUF6124 family protein n=1 Tax=Pseudomonas sp. BGI-2 TaxID=2528211 RepID=UPI0035317ED7